MGLRAGFNGGAPGGRGERGWKFPYFSAMSLAFGRGSNARRVAGRGPEGLGHFLIQGSWRSGRVAPSWSTCYGHTSVTQVRFEASHFVTMGWNRQAREAR
jgi:hypothetical protein